MLLGKVLMFILNHPLNRDHRIKAIVRFIKWQIQCRINHGDSIYIWFNGLKMVVRKGETGFTGNIYCGLFEFAEMGYLIHVLRNEDLFIDIGANVGSYTILASGVTNAKSISFEPVPTTFNRLKANCSINNLDGLVTCFNIGLSNKAETISFSKSLDATNHVLADSEQHTDAIQVEVNTLDFILKNKSPNVLKIDVEGFETRVLEGALETLQKESLHSVIMELNGSGNRYGFKDSTILEIMRSHGFSTYTYNPLDRTLKAQPTNAVTDGGNVLFLRNIDLIKNRILTAPKITVHGVSF